MKNYFKDKKSNNKEWLKVLHKVLKCLKNNKLWNHYLVKLVYIIFIKKDDSLISKATAIYNKNLPFKIYQNEDDLDINYL